MSITYYDIFSCSNKMIFDTDISDGSIGKCTIETKRKGETKEETWDYSVENNLLSINGKNRSTYIVTGKSLLHQNGKFSGTIPDLEQFDVICSHRFDGANETVVLYFNNNGTVTQKYERSQISMDFSYLRIGDLIVIYNDSYAHGYLVFNHSLYEWSHINEESVSIVRGLMEACLKKSIDSFTYDKDAYNLTTCDNIPFDDISFDNNKHKNVLVTSLNLWGKKIDINPIVLAIRQLSISLKQRVELHTSIIVKNRTDGVPAKMECINGKYGMSVVPYAWDNLQYVETCIDGIGAFVANIFNEYGISLNPNWNIINQKTKDELKKIEKTFGDLSGQACQAALNNQAMKYQQVYNEELAKDFGLSFGIISSSFTAHLLYAAQAAAKEQKDHARAEKAAIESMKTSHDEITVAIFEAMYPVYVNQIEPALINLLGRYYAYIASLLAKELGYSYDDICSIEDLSKDVHLLLNDNTTDDKEKVVNLLSADICSGEAVLYAIKKNLIDEEFVTFFAEAPQILKTNTQNAILDYLNEQKKNASLFNRDSLSDNVVAVIKNIKLLYSYKISTYENIIDSVYKTEIKKVCQKFDDLLRISKNPESLSAYAKTKRAITISNSDISVFLKYYEIFATEDMKKVIALIGSTEMDKFNEYLSAINEKISVEYEKHQQAERERKAREEQLARERREREEQHRREVEEKKRLIREEIQSLNNELESLGFALFGQKARRKAELKSLIAKKQAELNNVK